MKIAAVVGDIGGCKELLPAVKVLEARGHCAEWFVDDSPNAKAGTEVLAKAGVSYRTTLPGMIDDFDAVVVGTSATAYRFQNEFTRAAKGEIPVIWVEDFYGTAHHKEVMGVAPDILCVSDDLGREISDRARPGVRAFPCGKPSYAPVAEFIKNKEAIRREVRSKLAKPDGFAVVYSSTNVLRAVAAHLDALNQALGNIPGSVFWPRFHPKFSEKEIGWNLVKEGRTDFEDTLSAEPSLERLAIAADFLVCPWGATTQFAAALAGVPVVLLLFPDDRDRRITLGYPGGVPPLLLAEAGWGVNDEAMLTIITSLIAGDQPTASARVQTGSEKFKTLLKPGADVRIADIIERSL